MHNTLATSEYSLIDQDTHMPKPNYWAALLWTRLMVPKYTKPVWGRRAFIYLPIT